MRKRKEKIRQGKERAKKEKNKENKREEIKKKKKGGGGNESKKRKEKKEKRGKKKIKEQGIRETTRDIEFWLFATSSSLFICSSITR